jgi:hypothetical protein
MRALPEPMIRLLLPFAPLFSRRVWVHAQLLVMGAILAPGRQTCAPPPSGGAAPGRGYAGAHTR